MAAITKLNEKNGERYRARIRMDGISTSRRSLAGSTRKCDT